MPQLRRTPVATPGWTEHPSRPALSSMGNPIGHKGGKWYNPFIFLRRDPVYLERLVFQVKYGADLVSVLKKGNQIFERLGMPRGGEVTSIGV